MVKVNDGSSNYEMRGSLTFTRTSYYDSGEVACADTVQIWHNQPSQNLSIHATETSPGSPIFYGPTVLIGKEDIPALVSYLRLKYPEAF